MKNEVIETFLDLVKISSPSRKERVLADYIKDRLQAIDVEIMEDDCAKKINGNCGNLIVHIVGNGKPILFDAHMDTVMPCEEIHPRIHQDCISSDGTSILGADDKVGIATMLCLIETIKKEDIPHPELFFVFSVCEEDGLQGVKHIDKRLFKDVTCAYVLDGEGVVGTVVDRTPHGCKGTLSVIGKEAHAGVCPEQGINALKVASEAIAKLPMGRIHPYLTSNIGKIEGGTARNVVMGKVSMEFEARGYHRKELEEYVTYVKRSFHEVCDQYHAQFQEDIKFGTPGYTIEEDDTLWDEFEQICKRCGKTMIKESCGGGSNANVYRMHGIKSLCLGTNMKEVHSLNEHIGVQDIIDLYELLLSICRYKAT
ncbi:MAG: M20/M25/M40 family metallo-hydrolase [Longicatena sp.]